MVLSIAAVLTALFLAGCSTEDEPAQAKGGGKGKFKGGGGGAIPVVAAPAALRDVPIEIQVVGNVEASSTVSIRAQVSGQLTDVFFQDGTYVNKDDLLFRIDPRQIDGQLAQAEANLARSTAQKAQAEANLARDIAQENYARGLADRYGKLAAEGIMSRDQSQQTQASADALSQAVAADRAAIESAKAQMSADEAAINNIRIQKDYTTVRAPISGRTGNVVQKSGNIVTANQTELAVVHQVVPIFVSFAVPEARLSEIQRYFGEGGHLPVTVQAQDGSGQEERGELTFIDNSVDTTTGTIRLKGTFQNTNRAMWPGQFVNVTLGLTTRRNSIVVPNQAVQTGQEGTFVYVVKPDQTVEFRPVAVGPRSGLDLVIEQGLQAGEIVVTEGQLRLQPGSAVQVRGQGGPEGASSGGRGGPSEDGSARSGDGFVKDGKRKGRQGGPDGPGKGSYLPTGN